MSAFYQLFKSSLKDIARDRMALFWFVAFPVLFILLFGAIFSSENEVHFDIGFVNRDRGPIGEGLEEALTSIPTFTVHKENKDEALKALRAGQRTLIMEIPEDTSAMLGSGTVQTIPVYYDAAQANTSKAILPAVSQMLAEIERGFTNAPRLFAVDPRPVQAQNLRMIDYLLPGILAMALMQLGLFGSLRLVSLRERHVLRTIGATPLRRSHLLGSEILVRMVIALLQTLTITAIGYLVFGVKIIGSWIAVLGIVILGAATFVSMGYMLVSFTRSEESGQGILQMVQFPMMFLSGIFFPVDMMPDFLRPVIKVIPLTYLGNALRQVMVGASAPTSIVVSLGILAGWLVVSLVAAVRFWRWD